MRAEREGSNDREFKNNIPPPFTHAHCRSSGVGKLVPSWHVVPGICFESLAFQVAEDYGVPGDVVNRAKQLLRKLRSKRQQESLDDEV